MRSPGTAGALARKRRWGEWIIERALFASAFFAVLSVLFITVFIFLEGVPLLGKVSLREFLFSTYWLPSSRTDPGYGILGFIVGSFYVTFFALLFGVPVGVMCAIFLAEIAAPSVARGMRRVVELLAGIPSVVYGFFGVVVICPLVRVLFGGTGFSVLSGAIILAIMILPTITSISEAAIRSVPQELKQGAMALGATHWQALVSVVVPNARSGILAAIVLAMGRAIGETMAVLMVAGNAPIMPKGLTSKVRTLTMNIVTDMGYATDEHLTALFTTAIVLFAIIMLLNICVTLITRRITHALEGGGARGRG